MIYRLFSTGQNGQLRNLSTTKIISVAALVAHESAQLTPIYFHCSIGILNDS